MPVITGNDLVFTFRHYENVPYKWGGSLPWTGWDCSGACNYVCGVIYHLAIPGYNAGGWGPFQGHGPVVADWISWIGVTRGVFGPVQPVPGDLIAWGPNVHMGMAIDATRFVSAANPSAGTIEADIGSFFNYAPYVLRLLQIRTGATVPQGVPLPQLPAASSMTSWAESVRAVSNRTSGAVANLSRTAAAIRRL
jgi:cell wall-associated NlpC family hydrolase